MDNNVIEDIIKSNMKKNKVFDIYETQKHLIDEALESKLEINKTNKKILLEYFYCCIIIVLMIYLIFN